MSRAAGNDVSVRTPGVYVLLFRLPALTDHQIGCLGRFDLAAGDYAYVGSAQGGLEARVGRHLRGGGKKHWHIDHLLEHASRRRAFLLPTRDDVECELAEEVSSILGVQRPVKGFGSSDCRCPSHLFLLTTGAVRAVERTMSERGAILVAERRSRTRGPTFQSIESPKEKGRSKTYK